jgi:hypothetical protein
MSSLHKCEAPTDVEIRSYGIAINKCWQDETDKKLWVGNGEYSNTVKFCPFCGFTCNKE